MDLASSIGVLFENFAQFDVRMVAMWIIGGILMYLAIEKDMEPTLLLPMGFGCILVNLPLSGVINRAYTAIGKLPYLGELVTKMGDTGLQQFTTEGALLDIEHGPLTVLFDAGIANELMPLILFIGIGAMIDFGPLLSNPKMMFFGAAAQFGIFFAMAVATLLGFPLKDAAAVGIIGAADGPTSIFVAQYFNSSYMGAIIVAAYSYMALVPLVQPPVIKFCTTRNERMIRMPLKATVPVSKRTRILFPVVVTIVAGMIAPRSVALVGFLMFGNLLRECGCCDGLSQTAQHELANLITIFLGFTIAANMGYDQFLNAETILIMCLGLVAFTFDTVGGVFFGKLLNIFLPKDLKVNPMIGAAGISAFPMSSRVVAKIATAEDPQNFLLMHAVGANVSGQIASVLAGGMVVSLVAQAIAK